MKESGRANDIQIITAPDIADFDALFTEVYPQIFSIALIQLRNYHEAEDAVQEAAMLAYRSFGTLKNSEYFKTWITRILINCCNKQHRLLKRFSANEKSGFLEDKSVFTDDEIMLRDAIATLDKRSQQIVILRYFSDYTVQEISRTLDIPEGTVKSRLSRSIEKLKKYFAEKEALK